MENLCELKEKEVSMYSEMYDQYVTLASKLAWLVKHSPDTETVDQLAFFNILEDIAKCANEAIQTSETQFEKLNKQINQIRYKDLNL